MKVREGGRVRNIAVLVATGITDGHREVLGVQASTSETHAGWLVFVRDLVARGLSRVALVTSDAHTGLVEAIAATLAGASWQRWRRGMRHSFAHCSPTAGFPSRRSLG